MKIILSLLICLLSLYGCDRPAKNNTKSIPRFDSNATFSFSPQYSEASENFDDHATFTISYDLEGSPDVGGSVRFAATSGSAIPGIDFTPLDCIISFAVGERTKQVTVSLLEDNDYAEGNKTIVATLSSPTYGNIGYPSTSVCTVTPAPEGFTGWYADTIRRFIDNPSLVRTITSSYYVDIASRRSFKMANFPEDGTYLAYSYPYDYIGIRTPTPGVDGTVRSGIAAFYLEPPTIDDVAPTRMIYQSSGSEYLFAVLFMPGQHWINASEETISWAHSVLCNSSFQKDRFYPTLFLPRQRNVILLYARQGDTDGDKNKIINISFKPQNIPRNRYPALRPTSDINVSTINPYLLGQAIYGCVGYQGREIQEIGATYGSGDTLDQQFPASFKVEIAASTAGGYVAPYATWVPLVINGQISNSILAGDVVNGSYCGIIAPTNSWTFFGPSGWYMFRLVMTCENERFGSSMMPYEISLGQDKDEHVFSDKMIFLAYITTSFPNGLHDGTFTINGEQKTLFIDDPRIADPTVNSVQVYFNDSHASTMWTVTNITPGVGFYVTPSYPTLKPPMIRSVNYTIEEYE